MKIITWIDLEERYRITSPAYGDRANPLGETEAETVIRVWARIRARYGLPDDHKFHLVEDADQRARLVEISKTYFRYGVFNTNARAGAWEMDVDGRPKVNMAKARPIKIDRIRVERNARLAATDSEVSKLDGAAIPAALKTKRQALRDLPVTIQPDIDAINTPVALEAYEPSWPN